MKATAFWALLALGPAACLANAANSANAAKVAKKSETREVFFWEGKTYFGAEAVKLKKQRQEEVRKLMALGFTHGSSRGDPGNLMQGDEPSGRSSRRFRPSRTRPAGERFVDPNGFVQPESEQPVVEVSQGNDKGFPLGSLTVQGNDKGFPRPLTQSTTTRRPCPLRRTTTTTTTTTTTPEPPCYVEPPTPPPCPFRATTPSRYDPPCPRRRAEFDRIQQPRQNGNSGTYRRVNNRNGGPSYSMQQDQPQMVQSVDQSLDTMVMDQPAQTAQDRIRYVEELDIGNQPERSQEPLLVDQAKNMALDHGRLDRQDYPIVPRAQPDPLVLEFAQKSARQIGSIGREQTSNDYDHYLDIVAPEYSNQAHANHNQQQASVTRLSQETGGPRAPVDPAPPRQTFGSPSSSNLADFIQEGHAKPSKEYLWRNGPRGSFNW